MPSPLSLQMRMVCLLAGYCCYFFWYRIFPAFVR